MQNRKLRQDSIVQSRMYKNGGVLFTARIGRDGRHLQYEVQNRRLRQEAVLRSGRGTKTAEYCVQHALDGMVHILSRKCGIESWGKQLSFGVANSRTIEYCSQHARLQCDVEGFREREVGSHHSRKETIGNILPFILLPTRQIYRLVSAATLVSEYYTQK